MFYYSQWFELPAIMYTFNCTQTKMPDLLLSDPF